MLDLFIPFILKIVSFIIKSNSNTELFRAGGAIMITRTHLYGAKSIKTGGASAPGAPLLPPSIIVLHVVSNIIAADRCSQLGGKASLINVELFNYQL